MLLNVYSRYNDRIKTLVIPGLDQTPRNLKRLLYEEILGCDQIGDNQSMSAAHPDPFLRSMTLWILKDFTGSLNTLVQNNVGSMHPMYTDEDKQEGMYTIEDIEYYFESFPEVEQG